MENSTPSSQTLRYLTLAMKAYLFPEHSQITNKTIRMVCNTFKGGVSSNQMRTNKLQGSNTVSSSALLEQEREMIPCAYGFDVTELQKKMPSCMAMQHPSSSLTKIPANRILQQPP